jgi:hypothetical protein
MLYIPRVQVKRFFSLIKLNNRWKKKMYDKILRLNMEKEKEKKYKEIPYNKYYIKNNFSDKFIAKKETDIISIHEIGFMPCVDIEVDSEDHLFQLGGGLISHNSSMYVLETMFVDYETQECYVAYKTRDLLTLGYVRVPSPLHERVGVTSEFMADYEKKKDRHLDRLTGNAHYDETEERVSIIIKTKLFKTAEKIYIDKMGYMPLGMLVQVINKLYPEYKSSVIVGEIASRIKLNKEVSGEWSIPGLANKKKK